MARPSAAPASYISRLSFVGQSSGAVKQLGGFRPRHHSVPDAVNATTTAFLARLCGAELAEEAEGFFQRAKAALGYKRADLALAVTSPAAVLTARDFTLELDYALTPDDPARYVVTRTLHDVEGAAAVASAGLNTVFAGQFDRMVFALARGVRVEAVIDAVEAREGEGGLTVRYPSDCRQCVLAVAGVAAEVGCDGATLAMRFPRAGAPRELVAEFAAVREAFALTKDRVLAGLL